jgi:hypothetical protein
MKLFRQQKPLPIWSLVLRVSALFVSAYVLLLILAGRSGEAAISFVVGVMPIGVGSLAFGLAWRAWRAGYFGHRRAWLLMMVGVGMWAGAEWLYALSILLESTLLEVLADATWLGGYIPLGLSIVAFLQANRFELTPLKEVIAVIGGGLIPLLLFIRFVHPFRNPELIQVPGSLVVAALYPALDILIATGGLLCLMSSGSKPWQRPWFYIGGALTLFAYTDLWYWLLEFFQIQGSDVASAIRVDVPYSLAYVILAMGCWQVVAEERAQRTRPV